MENGSRSDVPREEDQSGGVAAHEARRLDGAGHRGRARVVRSLASRRPPALRLSNLSIARAMEGESLGIERPDQPIDSSHSVSPENGDVSHFGHRNQSGVGMNSRALIFSINSGPLTLDRNKVRSSRKVAMGCGGRQQKRHKALAVTAPRHHDASGTATRR